MNGVKKELMLNGVYVVSKETSTIEPFNPENHLETLANIYAAYMTIRTGNKYRVVKEKDFHQDEVLTAAQVAKILSVSRTHVYELMRRTDFPTINLSGSSKRVFRDDLLEWLRKRRVAIEL